jgi:GT2 family glycosyltransferase
VAKGKFDHPEHILKDTELYAHTLSHLLDQIEKRNQRISWLRNEHERMSHQVNIQEIKVQELEAQITELDREYKALKFEDLARVEMELDAKNVESIALKKKAKELEAELEKRSIELTVMTEKAKSLETELEEQSVELISKMETVERLEEKLKEMEEERKRRLELENKIKSLKDTLESQKDETRRIEQASDQMRSNLEVKVNQLEAELVDRDRRLATMMEELQWYTTGLLPDFLRWSRGWASRHLPLESRRRKIITLIAKGALILVRDGPRVLWTRIVHRIRTQKVEQTKVREAPKAVEPQVTTQSPNHDSTQIVRSLVEVNANEAILVEETDRTLPPERIMLQARLRQFLVNPENRLVFQRQVQPLVSILMLTYNKAELTYQCLESILTHTKTNYELIIVDNASSDETHELLDRLDNVTIFRNSENLEFILANNLGAKVVRGRYLLFLNNDVCATPNWLSSLVDTMESDLECGAVGSKYVWPHGGLQEAGSIIWQDGSALGYGRGDDPFRPEYNYFREVDYCSGGCLLVRTELFRKLGFFDERYLPAFYEDSDLCFGIRHLGYHVYYQPKSSIFHFEFASRTPERALRLCQQNQDRFLEKWEEILREQQPARPTDPFAILKARDRRQGKRVLVMDDMIPAPRLGSGFPRARTMLELMVDLGYVVTFIPLSNRMKWQPDTQKLQDLGVEVFYDDWYDPSSLLKDREDYYDIVVVSRPHNGQKWLREVRKRNPQALIVYDAEAIFARRDNLRAKIEGRRLSKREQRRSIENELAVIKYSDVVVTVSDDERSIIKEYSPHSNIVVWGHVHSVSSPITPFKDRNDLLFVGGFTGGHPPNTDAVLHFSQNIFPLVQRELPDCKFYIVGSNPPKEVRDLGSDSIIVTGFVEDLREYYERCRVFIAPLRFAGGIAYKITEALSHGIPAVVSPIAATGLNVTDGIEVLIAEDVDEYATKIIRLYSDENLWSRISATSMKYIDENCSQDVLKSHLDAILNQAPAM